MDDGSLTTSVSPNGQFRLGLIGAGRMGRTHLEVLDASPGISIAGVAEPNAAAIALYHRHGWVDAGLRPGYYNHGTVTAVVMKKRSW